MVLKNYFKKKTFCIFLLIFILLNIYLSFNSYASEGIESRKFQYSTQLYYDMLNEYDDNDFFDSSINFINDTNTHITYDYSNIDETLEEIEIEGIDEYIETGSHPASVNIYTNPLSTPAIVQFVDSSSDTYGTVYYYFYDLTEYLLIQLIFIQVSSDGTLLFRILDDSSSRIFFAFDGTTNYIQYYNSGWINIPNGHYNNGQYYNFTIEAYSGNVYAYLNGSALTFTETYTLIDGIDTIRIDSGNTADSMNFCWSKLLINEKPEIIFTENHLSTNDLYQLHFVFNISGKFSIYGIESDIYYLFKTETNYNSITSCGISDLYDTILDSYDYIVIVLDTNTILYNIQVFSYLFNNYEFYNTKYFEADGYPSLLDKIDGYNTSCKNGNLNYLSYSYIINNSDNINLNLHLDNYSTNYMSFRSFPSGYNYASDPLSTIEYTYIQFNLSLSISTLIKSNLTLYYVDDISEPSYTYDSYLLENGFNTIRIGENKLLWIFSLNFSEIENNFLNQDILISFSNFSIYFNYLGPIQFQTIQIQEVISSLIIFLIIPSMTIAKFKKKLRSVLIPIFMLISSIICLATGLISSWMFAVIDICLIIILLIHKDTGDL